MSAFMFGNEGRTVARSGSRARDEIGRRPAKRLGENAGAKRRCAGDFRHARRSAANVLRRRKPGAGIGRWNRGPGPRDRYREPGGLAFSSAGGVATARRRVAVGKFHHSTTTRKRTPRL